MSAFYVSKVRGTATGIVRHCLPLCNRGPSSPTSHFMCLCRERLGIAAAIALDH